MIKANKINKTYGFNHVLKNVDIELKPKEVTVLVGPSGCGKTTLLRNLCLLDTPDSGSITVFNTTYNFPESKTISPNFYPRLTVVFQQLFLWPNLTNRENILLGIENKKLQNNIDFIDYLIQGMDMKPYIDKYPNQSSLGQKQRIAIARALILNPDYILFDEITASLDILQIKKLIYILLSLVKDKIGFLFITHNIEIAKKIGDNLIFMKDGRIIETGGIEILSFPNTSELNEYLFNSKI